MTQVACPAGVRGRPGGALNAISKIVDQKARQDVLSDPLSWPGAARRRPAVPGWAGKLGAVTSRACRTAKRAIRAWVRRRAGRDTPKVVNRRGLWGRGSFALSKPARNRAPDGHWTVTFQVYELEPRSA